MKNFWKELSGESVRQGNSRAPFFVLAPMADVTDVSFREFIALSGKPDVMYTEFVACRGLRSDKGRQALLRDLYYTKRQRPIVAQVFGGDPEDFLWCAQFIRELGFDGIDVNMGCPVKKMVGQGAGASLILDPPRARAIIRALKEGAGDMPVAVKTRIGYNTIDTENWIGEILKEKPSALIVHLRTRKEMSMVPAHWEEMPKIVEMAHSAGVVVVGNGDVANREEGERRARESGCDGIMIGRGIFGNPWVFHSVTQLPVTSYQEQKMEKGKQGVMQNAKLKMKNGEQKRFDFTLGKKENNKTSSEIQDTKYDIHEARLRALRALVTLFDGVWGETKNYDILKKHYSSYVRGFVGAKEIRMRLMETKSAREALEILSDI